MKRFTEIFLPIVLLLGALAMTTSVGEPDSSRRGKPRPWEHESSDLPVDPRIRFGHLPSGLRFAWIRNPEPDERCSIRLHVNAGSLVEGESERGMAHFLEHMAFNGSKRFPAGTLIEWFQKHGMAFGADTNARTGFVETVYDIDLPTSKPESIREGLAVLRDFADGLLLQSEEIEAEKGVIDGEERERDSAGFRVLVRMLDLKYAGTRYPERLPIGTAEARARFTAESMRAFYEAWYRPENLTLVLAGDLGDLDPEPLIREAFEGMKVPEAEPAEEPPVGKPTLEHRAFFIQEKEIPTVQIAIERLRPWKDRPARVATWLEDVPVDYARAMVNLRFSERAKEENAPFLAASLEDATQFDVFDGESLSILTEPEKWQEALAACEQELRRALEHGFQEAELAEVRADALRALDEAVAREKTRSTLSYVQELLAAAARRVVPVDAEARRKILRPAIEALDPKKCHEALVRSWRDGTLVVSGVGNLDLGEDAGKALLEAYETSRQVEVAAPQAIRSEAWAYASDPDESGEVVARRHLEDPDLHLVEFANGVRLNVKKTDFKDREILLVARLAEGGLTLPREKQVLRWVADRVFDQSGLEAHSEDDLRRLTAGRLAGVGFTVADDAFVLSGATSPEDLLLQLEMMCAYLAHPGWREEGLRRLARFAPQIYEALQHQPQGPMMTRFLPDLYGGDPRFGFPKLEDVLAVKMDDLRAWLAPQLATGPIELTAVGDVDVDEVIRLAARTFGRLPQRRAAERYEERRKVDGPRVGIRSTYEIDTAIPKSAIVAVFPTTDGIEAQRRRRLQFLGSVVNDRLRVEIREKLGAAYSPGAASMSSPVYPGDGMILLQAMADPGEAEKLLEACLAAMDRMVTEGISEEEANRLREPILTSLRETVRTNGFWIAAVAEAQSKPHTLEDLRMLETHYRETGAEELNELAKKYLSRKRASTLVVLPEGE
jgi:zinc protease